VNGKLVDVFEISGRGVVVLVEIDDGRVKAGDTLILDESRFPITGVEMVNYNAEGRQRLAEGWVPPVGLSLRGAKKPDIEGWIGREVGTVEQRNEGS
jgi:translation elongation factor EF-Tu-like GTPase